MKISPLAPTIGGRIEDCDLTQTLSTLEVKEIQNAFLEHAVLLFPSQQLKHHDQLSAAQIFGESGTLHRPRELQPKAYESLPDGIMMISNIREDGVPIQH